MIYFSSINFRHYSKHHHFKVLLKFHLDFHFHSNVSFKAMIIFMLILISRKKHLKVNSAYLIIFKIQDAILNGSFHIFIIFLLIFYHNYQSELLFRFKNLFIIYL